MKSLNPGQPILTAKGLGRRFGDRKILVGASFSLMPGDRVGVLGVNGVGKSTLTTNLAVALNRMGVKVGVVDADIYGPSQPKLLAAEGTKPEAVGEKLVPVISKHGVPVLSMGFLVKPAQALAWRGPMAGNATPALEQV